MIITATIVIMVQMIISNKETDSDNSSKNNFTLLSKISLIFLISLLITVSLSYFLNTNNDFQNCKYDNFNADNHTKLNNVNDKCSNLKSFNSGRLAEICTILT